MTKIATSRRMDQIVRYELVEDVVKDIKHHLIFSEADLQSCVHYHLRDHIRRLRNPKWLALNKPHLGKKRVFPDIVIFYGFQPRIAIELKWWPHSWKGTQAKKDRKKLKMIREKYKSVAKAFFLYVYAVEEEGDEKQFYEGLKWENHYYFDIPINIRKMMRKRGYDHWAEEWNRHKFEYEEI